MLPKIGGRNVESIEKKISEVHFGRTGRGQRYEVAAF